MMMSCMLGSTMFGFFNPRANTAKLMVIACSLAAVCFWVVQVRIGRIASVYVIYGAFLCFEVCAGLYMPAVGALKSELVPEEARAGIYNFYRVPLNLVVIGIMLSDMDLHSTFSLC